MHRPSRVRRPNQNPAFPGALPPRRRRLRAAPRDVVRGALLTLIVAFAAHAEAAKVVSVEVLDQDYLAIHLLDGEVLHESPGEQIVQYSPALDPTTATEVSSYTLTSAEDANYDGAGRSPVAVSRKTKISGQAQLEWLSSDYRYEYTDQHWLYLELPDSLAPGATYTLTIAPATNLDTESATFTFDVYQSRSEAVHVNLVGYAPEAPHKAADLYYWLGDGGARDYSAFEGNAVYLYDVATGAAHEVGQVTYFRDRGSDLFWYDLTGSDVWNVDFSGFSTPGTYRLVVDGVGCSQDFVLAPDVYADPFKVSVRGFFYMRIGQDNAAGLEPAPRTPLYLPGAEPPSTTIYLTDMQPWHPEWDSFTGGDRWDNPNAWAAYRQAGNPTNPDAWGGHSDAADWDRHLGHVSIIYDMLLPFVLTDGAIDDDDAGIAESGNGIPDLLDEAQNEVDFWLRLRDGEGYSHGLTNPNDDDELFQAGASPLAAWANAANCAMLADAFRIAGLTDRSAEYQAAAEAAYRYADGLADPMLDEVQDVGDGNVRGRDLKLTAAAYLYNVTGDTAWEAVVEEESVCAGGPAVLDDGDRNQIWATAGYLFTPRTVNFPTLWENMKAAVIAEAETEEASHIDLRPSRRATDDRTGYFRTAQNVHRTLIAHAITDDPAEKARFHKALALEADWGLGRNSLNMIEMTTATTPLADKRSCEHIYTAGREDGLPGMDPGHTPYLNFDDWDGSMTMGSPSHLYATTYPGNFRDTWPVAEGYFDTPWVWAYSEFTPQQTMRGKMALYGYLYGMYGGSAGGTGGTGGTSGSGGSGPVTGGAGGASGDLGGATGTGAAATAGGTGAPPSAGGEGGAEASGGGAGPSSSGAAGSESGPSGGTSADGSGGSGDAGGAPGGADAIGGTGVAGATAPGVGGGAAASSGSGSKDDGGCGCAVPAHRTRWSWSLAGLALAWIAGQRRSRRAPPAPPARARTRAR